MYKFKIEKTSSFLCCDSELHHWVQCFFENFFGKRMNIGDDGKAISKWQILKSFSIMSDTTVILYQSLLANIMNAESK
jgi:hypothetical protein